MPFLGKQPSRGLVGSADIDDNAVTLAKMAAGTDGNIISYDASGDPVAIATGDDGQALHSAGAGAPPAFEDVSAGWTLTSEVSESSGVIAFTGIPATVKSIIIMYEAISISSVHYHLAVKLGDSGGVESSGYIQGTRDNVAANAPSGTTYWPVTVISTSIDLHGAMHLWLKDSTNNTWAMTGCGGGTNSTRASHQAGTKSLSGTLTQISIASTNGAEIDGGTISLLYQ